MECGKQSELDELRLEVQDLGFVGSGFKFQDSGKKPRLISDEAFFVDGRLSKVKRDPF